MNFLLLLFLGQALLVVRKEQTDADPEAGSQGLAAGAGAEDAIAADLAEDDDDDEGSDAVEVAEQEEQKVAPGDRANWLPACDLTDLKRPELMGDPNCRLSLTVKRTKNWVASTDHALYLRGTKAGKPLQGKPIATANGFTRLNKKVTIKYFSDGKQLEATLKRDYCEANTICKLYCKFGEVDEIVNSPVDVLTYTMCDLSQKRGPTTFKLFYNNVNPKLDTIVRMTGNVFGSVKPTEGLDRKHREVVFLPFQIKELYDLLKGSPNVAGRRVVKSSNKNGMLTDGSVDVANPSKFNRKPAGQNRYSAQTVRGKYGEAREMYFVDAHHPWSALDAFAYSLVMSDNNADSFQGTAETVKGGLNKLLGK